jgi:ATP-dependent RNA helicase DDX24/MAK5
MFWNSHKNNLGTPNSVLLATDVAARGLDIKGIENVIHYQIPRTAEDYVHRSGRTARASQRGMTIMLLDPQDVSRYRKICKNLKRGMIL